MAAAKPQDPKRVILTKKPQAISSGQFIIYLLIMTRGSASGGF